VRSDAWHFSVRRATSSFWEENAVWQASSVGGLVRLHDSLVNSEARLLLSPDLSSFLPFFLLLSVSLCIYFPCSSSVVHIVDFTTPLPHALVLRSVFRVMAATTSVPAMTAASAMLFSRETQAIFYNPKTDPVQRMLDFDHVCRRPTPSIAALVTPGSTPGQHKAFFGTYVSQTVVVAVRIVSVLLMSLCVSVCLSSSVSLLSLLFNLSLSLLDAIRVSLCLGVCVCVRLSHCGWVWVAGSRCNFSVSHSRLGALLFATLAWCSAPAVWVAFCFPLLSFHSLCASVLHASEELLLPMYVSIESAAKAHPNADVFINFASFRSANASSLAALDVPSIRTVVIIAEGVPEADVRVLIAKARSLNKVVIGPSTVGGIQAGAFKIADTAGTIDNVVNCKLYRPGSVGVVSKSGGLSNELYNILSRTTDGLFEGVAIGGDVFAGSTFSDHILRYEHIPQIKMIVLLGEIGGEAEYGVVELLRSKQVTKPVVAWVSGTCAKMFKTEVQFGHAGAKSGGQRQSAEGLLCVCVCVCVCCGGCAYRCAL
jgi:succinyl-CoA synthetase alpha subunit